MENQANGGQVNGDQANRGQVNGPNIPNNLAVENRPVVVSSTNIRPFDVTRPTEWLRWVKLLNFNFTARHITDKVMKRAHFFTVCGEPLYNLACNTLHHEQVDEVDYDLIITKLRGCQSSMFTDLGTF